MKLLRMGPIGHEQPAMLGADGVIRDLSGVVPDISGAALNDDSMAKLRAIDPATLPVVDPKTRIGACVGSVGKVICIGLNYSDHAAETGAEVPSEPIIFLKSPTTISGPNDDVMIPRGSKKTDWEVELGVIVGTKAQYVSEADALNHVAGYCVANDVSEREWQLERGGQWTKGKSADTFSPIGPWLVTRDEISDPQKLKMWCDIDGHRYQNGSTQTMVFGVAFLVSYLSQFMTLMPGDVISTGTPPGVGLGQKPPIYLKKGQVMQLGVAGLGEQRQVLGQA